MDEVPLKTIEFGKWLKCSTTQPSCFLSCPKSVPLLEFAWRSDNSEDDKSVIFQCGDISAVDVRVETKFGAIDSMKGTIIVECLSPIFVQNVDSDNVGSSTAKDVNKVVNISGVKNFIIEATFHVNETEAVRRIIRQLRDSCSREESKTGVENESTKTPKPKITTFKEGLPNWVRFIPHYLYSRRTRRTIELAIFLYMIFSVTWALWQLYRYVDFIRELLTPLIDLLQYQYQLLDNFVHLFNTIFEKYTVQWLCFIKPLYTVGTMLASPLLKILSQLSPLFLIILQSLKTVWDALKPVAKPIFSIGYQFAQFTITILRSIKMLVARFWSPLYNALVPAVRRALGAVYYGSLYQARHFDPLKAQLGIVRTTVINSAKALGLGTAHLLRQIYKIIWLRRSARTRHKEE